MKKIIKSTLILAFFITSCTKETYVEGLIPETTIIDINQTKEFVNDPNYYLSSSNFDFFLDTRLKKLKFYRYTRIIGAYSYLPYPLALTTDSVLEISLKPTGIQQAIDDNNGAGYTQKYSKNEIINPFGFTTFNSSLGGTCLIASKKSPFNNAWIEQNTYQTTWQMPLYKFRFNEKSYIGFNELITNTEVNYGWIEVTFSEKSVTINRIGYQKYFKIKAGD